MELNGINLINLDAATLPSVAIADREKLPEIPCIYFAIDSQDTIQYIGKSTNPRKRWQSHHRHQELDEIGGVKIAYLEVSSPELLSRVEAALIQWFSPVLNGRSDPKKRSIVHYAEGVNAACGMETGRYAELATIGHQVTCKACKRSVKFRNDHPGLAIASTGGRPKAQGVQRTIKFWVSPELNHWLNAQGVVADTIVRALTELRRKSE